MKELAQQTPITGRGWLAFRFLLKHFHRPSLIVFLLFAFSVFVAGCGGKTRPPPGVPVPVGIPPASKAGVSKKAAARDTQRLPRVRILLRENFGSIRVEGSNLGPKVFAYVNGRTIRLTGAEEELLKAGSGFRLEPSQGRLLRLDGLPYRGALEIFINPMKQPVVVNDVDVEEYLKGVVANELSPTSFPQSEAIKAQSVAARTFAISSLGQYASRGFDLYDDQRSQFYRGERSETTLSNRVIEQTRGVLATYRNEPIVAFYSSTCGGVTEDYQAAFKGAEIPYLRGGVKCPDKSSPYRSWNHRISVSDVQNNLSRLVRVGRLMKLVTLRKSRAGRIVEMKFVGNKGAEIVRRFSIRRALGLRSNWITNLDPRYDGSGYIVEIRARGRGWGHGVGLCQMGSVALAERGWNYQRILKHYYPGTDLSRHW